MNNISLEAGFSFSCSTGMINFYMSLAISLEKQREVSFID